MTTIAFKDSKQFGDKLEKRDAITVIKKLHPDCTIDSPDNTGKFRDEDGLAIPDHTVKQGNKIVAFYDSKNKKHLYDPSEATEKVWSTDEKLFDYRKYATKHKAPCYLIFYNKKNDKKNVYIVNVNVKPKFYRRVNNEHGKHWYGYYISQTTPYSITKHNENIRESDIQEIWNEKDLNKKKILVHATLDRCEPERSNKHMDPRKIREMRRQVDWAKTPLEIDNIITNLLLKGEGHGMNNKNYNQKIYD